MRQLSSSSFEYHEPDEIAQASVVESFVSLTRSNDKAGGETWACAWAPDHSYFAWSSGHRYLHLIPWDIKNQKRHDPSSSNDVINGKYHIIDCNEVIWSLAFGSGRDQKDICGYGVHFDTSLIVATGFANGKIKLWNCFQGSLIIELLDHREVVRDLHFSLDGNLQLLSASRDGSIKMWDIPDGGNMYSTFKPHGVQFHGCRFSPNGKFIAAVGTKRMVYLWEGNRVNNLWVKLDGHYNTVSSCDFSPCSSLLATASYDTKVIVWNVHTHAKICILGHLYPSPRMIFAGGANGHYVHSVTFCPSGLALATVCEDGYARFWRLDEQPGDPFAIATIPEAVSGQMAPQSNVLSVGSREGDVLMLSINESVPPLVHLARQAVLRNMTQFELDTLPIPTMLKEYLCYFDLGNVP